MPFEYLYLDKASSILDLSVSEIIHLGAFGEIFVCVNIYAMASCIHRIKIGISNEDKKAYFSLKSSQLMPAGIHEVDQETLRLLELPDADSADLHFAYKYDDLGWWETYFDPPISITKSHLVLLRSEIDRFVNAQKQPHGMVNAPDPEIGSQEWRKENARRAANKRHDQAGGSRDKQEKIRTIWATGKYISRDVCAEQECGTLGMSFSAARKALINTPDP